MFLVATTPRGCFSKASISLNIHICWKRFLYQGLCLYPELKSGQRNRRRHAWPPLFVHFLCMVFVACCQRAQPHCSWEVKLQVTLGHKQAKPFAGWINKTLQENCVGQAPLPLVSAPGLGVMCRCASECNSMNRTYVWITVVLNRQHGHNLNILHLSLDYSLLHILHMTSCTLGSYLCLPTFCR